jgi:hypothetical protein
VCSGGGECKIFTSLASLLDNPVHTIPGAFATQAKAGKRRKYEGK